jgi:hypothetical protein
MEGSLTAHSRLCVMIVVVFHGPFGGGFPVSWFLGSLLLNLQGACVSARLLCASDTLQSVLGLGRAAYGAAAGVFVLSHHEDSSNPTVYPYSIYSDRMSPF